MYVFHLHSRVCLEPRLQVPVEAAGAWGAPCCAAQKCVPESVVREEEMCSELRRSAGTVVAFNLPFCFVPEGTENRWMRWPPGF